MRLQQITEKSHDERFSNHLLIGLSGTRLSSLPCRKPKGLKNTMTVPSKILGAWNKSHFGEQVVFFLPLLGPSYFHFFPSTFNVEIVNSTAFPCTQSPPNEAILCTNLQTTFTSFYIPLILYFLRWRNKASCLSCQSFLT